MSKSAIDAEYNPQIYRKNNGAIIAIRRDLTQISPVRLAHDGKDYYMGTCLVRDASTGPTAGQFKRFSAASGAAFDTPCVLFEDVLQGEQDQAVTGGSLARGIMSAAGLYKLRMVDYSSAWKTAAVAKELTDATGVTVVKF